MKQVLTSAGILALGAASIYALDPEMTRQQTGNPFSLSATVRGFYDDNITTARDGDEQDSFGFQVTPGVHLNLPFEQTFLSVGYLYSFTWYEERQPRNYDQSHEFNAKLRHQFTPRHKIAVDDTFVVTSEPTVVDRSRGIITTPTRETRSKSDVYHNYGAIDYTFGLTRTLGISLGYANHWYDYEAEGVGSRSALLDRLEHTIRADLRYQFNPKLVGIVGYSFGFSDFTGDEAIIDGADLQSDDRNNRSHYAYVGAEYDITAKLKSSIRIGAQFADFYAADQTSANPYVDASLSYLIRPGTSVEAGVTHARNATDVASTDSDGTPTLDAETTSVYAQLEHRIMRKLTGTLLGQFQHSVYNDGRNDGETEDLWLVGVNFSYTFNRHWSAEAGYNYDILESNLKEDRSYDRNRVYIGVTARY